jgi:DNA-binding SARP family transcriptional activator
MESPRHGTDAGPLLVRTFGPPAVLSGGRRIGGSAAQPRRLALLVILARAGGRGVSRDKLIALLFPGQIAARARHRLAHAVYCLRRDLGEGVITGTHVIGLDPAAITSEVREYSAARAAGRLEEAAELYAAPFLDGFYVTSFGEFERWVECERQALADEQSDVLCRLAQASEQRNDPATALTWWRRLSAHDPFSERATVGLMRVMAARGDVEGALRHGQRYRRLVVDDLEAPLGVEAATMMASLEQRRRRRIIPLTDMVLVDQGTDPLLVDR